MIIKDALENTQSAYIFMAGLRKFVEARFLRQVVAQFD